MSKHTQGPWTAKPIGNYSNPRLVLLYPDKRSGVHMRRLDIAGEFMKNDALILAEAPEMLAALEAAIACGMVPITSASEGGASKYSEIVRVADRIRTVVARAKGEA